MVMAPLVICMHTSCMPATRGHHAHVCVHARASSCFVVHMCSCTCAYSFVSQHAHAHEQICTCLCTSLIMRCTHTRMLVMRAHARARGCACVPCTCTCTASACHVHACEPLQQSEEHSLVHVVVDPALQDLQHGVHPCPDVGSRRQRRRRARRLHVRELLLQPARDG